MAEQKKPIAHFTGRGAFVTTTYVDERGTLVATTRASKIQRGGRSKVTREEVEAFKKRRAAASDGIVGDPRRRRSGLSAFTTEQVEEFKRRRAAGGVNASDRPNKRK
jgi:hypothetical protein